jgi:dTDP-glucose pyrophosphorylase
MLMMQVGPRETVIFEDSYHGLKSAFDSGAHVFQVSSPAALTRDFVAKQINRSESFRNAPPIKTDNLTVVVPMAGSGSRFAKAGYKDHKPMIAVQNDTVLGLTLKSLANIDAKFVFIVQKAHYDEYDLGTRLRLIKPGCEIVQINGLTEGAACTILLAEKQINNDDHLLIINSDNLIIWSRDHLLHMLSSGIDGGIVVFKATDPKWSFAKEGADGFVLEVAEKKPISNLATAGIYHWRKGSDFVKFAKEMIKKNIRVNNEFYTCPVYNEAIQSGKKIKTYECDAMWGLGTPEDLRDFEKRFKE